MFPPLNLPLYTRCLFKAGFYSRKSEGIDAFLLTLCSGTCVVQAAAVGARAHGPSNPAGGVCAGCGQDWKKGTC